MDNPAAGPLYHPDTDEEIFRISDRGRALIDRATQAKGRLLVPAAVLTEYLLKIPREQCDQHLAILNGSAAIEILPFEETAAIECAYIVEGDELAQMEETKSKIRADRQVLASVLAANADELWTHDKNLYRKAKEIGVSVACLGDIDPRPEQHELLPRGRG